jgi:hypothetical protein
MLATAINAPVNDDAFYFVDNRLTYGEPDQDRFWREGERDLDRLLGALGVEEKQMAHGSLLAISGGLLLALPTSLTGLLDWLDEAVNLCARYGISVVMGTPTYVPPPWLIRLWASA